MSKLEYRILPVTPFQQNCTLVWDADTGKGAFVDPGGDIDQLFELAEQQGVEIEKILESPDRGSVNPSPLGEGSLAFELSLINGRL